MTVVREVVLVELVLVVVNIVVVLDVVTRSEDVEALKMFLDDGSASDAAMPSKTANMMTPSPQSSFPWPRLGSFAHPHHFEISSEHAVPHDAVSPKRGGKSTWSNVYACPIGEV